LPKFSRSVDRSVAGGRKVYFSDTGMLQMLASVTDGQVFENAIVNQLSPYGGMSFYHKRNSGEIDIILDGARAFEVKVTGTQKYVDEVQRVAKELKLQEAFVISKTFKKDLGHIVYPFFF
jgi:predicted AAA+ superfamily ATPase